MAKVDNLAKGWIGSVGAKTGAAVVHAAKMPTQYILARESMQVQCDGAMADVKVLPPFTAKRSPGCLGDVLHDILERNPDLQLVVVRLSGKDLEHLFEYATVDGDGRQETVYLENRDDDVAWTSEHMPPKGPLGKAHHGKDLCSTASACLWRRIQVCQAPCTPSEATPLTNGVNMGQEQRPLGYG